MAGHSVLRHVALGSITLLILLAGPAHARLEAKEWRKVEKDAKRLFAKPGEREAKAAVIALLVQDSEKRGWRITVDALVNEAEHWVTIQKAVRDKEHLIDEVQSRPLAKRTPAMQRNLGFCKKELEALEEAVRNEHATLNDLTDVVAKGPETLRKNLFSRAKDKIDWPVRAAAARVAAVQLDEKLSLEFLTKVLAADKDPRVRLAGLEALRTVVEGKEDAPRSGEGKTVGSARPEEALILGRLADADWGVRLLAVQLVDRKHMTRAVPHLINALTDASPRVAITIGDALRSLTREGFGDYPRAWLKLVGGAQEEYESRRRTACSAPVPRCGPIRSSMASASDPTESSSLLMPPPR